MKQKKLLNYLFYLIIIFIFLYNQAPVIWSNYQSQNIKLESLTAIDLITNKKIELNNQKVVLLFWATWCAPCKLEMTRLKKAVENNEIYKNKIIAINPFEDTLTIKKYLTKNQYPFIFVANNSSFKKSLNIMATPTIIHLNNLTVDYKTSGISIFGIYRAIWFLNNSH